MLHEYELAVVKGLKKGVRTPITADQQISIGTQLDCDVVLSECATADTDVNTMPARAILHHDSANDVFSVLVVSGSIQQDNLAVPIGTTFDVAPGMPVEIGASTIVVSKVIQASAAPAFQQARCELSEQSSIVVGLSNYKNAINKMSVAVVVCAVIASSLAFWMNNQDVGVAASDRVTTFLRQLIARPQATPEYRDVAGLKRLIIESSPLDATMQVPVSNDFEVMPGKRIVMVVSTEPAYILTEDGSRYFTGSILPSGHKVNAILEQKVELELDQHTTEVFF